MSAGMWLTEDDEIAAEIMHLQVYETGRIWLKFLSRLTEQTAPDFIPMLGDTGAMV